MEIKPVVWYGEEIINGQMLVYGIRKYVSVYNVVVQFYDSEKDVFTLTFIMHSIDAAMVGAEFAKYYLIEVACEQREGHKFNHKA